jgi:hypothetical protein
MKIILRECILKKIEMFFLQYIEFSDSSNRRTNDSMAAVNPKLATLMRVIEDNQGKMTEGEYLEAMNALGALHREIPAAAVAVPPPPPAAPPSYNASAAAGLFAPQVPEVMGGNLTEMSAWQNVRTHHPDPFQNRISAEEWMLLSYEIRFRLLREAKDYFVSKKEISHRTPEPSVCPFITRHAVGLWSDEDDGNTNWECVCGYLGKVRNWKKHEQSERHQEWAAHRTVSRRKIQKMKASINDDEVGHFIRFASYAPNPAGLYPGGIRFYPVWQDKNEWTHPELFAEFHRSPVPVFHLDECGNVGETTTTWFVHRRNIWARQYVQ